MISGGFIHVADIGGVDGHDDDEVESISSVGKVKYRSLKCFLNNEECIASAAVENFN